MIRHIALKDHNFGKDGGIIQRGDIFENVEKRQKSIYSKVFAPFDTLKEVNVLEIDNGDRYIIGKGIVACVLVNGQCSVVRSPLLSLNDVQALIKIAYYKAVNNIR